MCLGEWRLFFIMSSISWALFFTSSLRECGLGLSSLCLGLLLIRSSFGPSLFRYVGWDSQKVEQDIRESFLKNKEGLHIPFLSNIKEFLDDNKSFVCPGEMSVKGHNNLKLCFCLSSFCLIVMYTFVVAVIDRELKYETKKKKNLLYLEYLDEYKIKVFHRPTLSFDDHKKDYECDKIFGLSFLTLIMQFCSSPTFGCFWSNCAPSLLMITRKTTDVIEPLDCFS
ncbi:hypothetical protein RhiirA1_445096 [Rhizophagus irregularis]|uniref:Uncharacterized protein n=1 Tax=Rhizophagus irregularis TaxID=588596 RepID=A0A2N0R9X5_9GLOM|nr:hypothetical protein RhiirA1_445096 [Rhizophagus irregularis]